MSTRAEVKKVIASGVNSSPGAIDENKLLSEIGYSQLMRNNLATRINHHFWDTLNQFFSPWLTMGDTGPDQKVKAVLDKVETRNPRAKHDGDMGPP